MWPFSKKQTSMPVSMEKRSSIWSTHAHDDGCGLIRPSDRVNAVLAHLPVGSSDGTMDDSSGCNTLKQYAQFGSNMSEQLQNWYVSQGFIGHHLCAWVSQQWLVNKACTMPGRDAIRRGWDIVSADGDDLDPKMLKILHRYDKSFRLKHNMEQFVRMGRIFGIRIAFFQVESTDPDYYEKPFNLDGVTPGSYKGIVQIDPYWCAPELRQASASQPDRQGFYEPDYWLINGRRYHKSHLVIYRPYEVPDILKPSYLYGGLSIPQLIMERVYGGERTANEAPLLAMNKRATVFKTDMERFAANEEQSYARLNSWVQFRDNNSLMLADKEADEVTQFDTGLADLDAVIMTQYQIVAAIANVPATKLLGTAPKGFNSSGNYETESYHEELESIQEHDLSPMLERHHLLTMVSYVVPQLKCEPVETVVTWRPVASMSDTDLADVNLKKAQIGAALIASGAIDGQIEHERISMDKHSGYHGVGVNDADSVSEILDDIERQLEE